MHVGYARVSTPEQSIEAQLERLCDCERIFSEKLSGKKDDRPQLQAAMEFVRQGDTLVATRLDRLARSVSHLCGISEELRRKGVELAILDQAIDTSTPSGTFLFHMLAAVAEFELTLRKEAQRAGIAHARAAGKPTGRPRVITPGIEHGIRIARSNGSPISAIARAYHVSKTSVRRALSPPDPIDSTFLEPWLWPSSGTSISQDSQGGPYGTPNG